MASRIVCDRCGEQALVRVQTVYLTVPGHTGTLDFCGGCYRERYPVQSAAPAYEAFERLLAGSVDSVP